MNKYMYVCMCNLPSQQYLNLMAETQMLGLHPVVVFKIHFEVWVIYARFGMCAPPSPGKFIF